MRSLLLALALVATLAGCATPRQDNTDWGALSRQVGKQINHK
jgi:ABC-type uncharacterized transport system auxiliary subunit